MNKYGRKIKVQMVEPFVLFDNLAQGALSETDEGIQEWADQHGLDIATIAEDNINRLKSALYFACKRTGINPAEFDTDIIFDTSINRDGSTKSNSLVQTHQNKVELNNQTSKLDRKTAKA